MERSGRRRGSGNEGSEKDRGESRGIPTTDQGSYGEIGSKYQRREKVEEVPRRLKV